MRVALLVSILEQVFLFFFFFFEGGDCLLMVVIVNGPIGETWDI